jgi:hypothetical protein
MKYTIVFSIVLATVLGAQGPTPATALAGAQAPCRLFSGIDVARYLGGPATFSSAPDGSICLARRGIAVILKAQVQNDRQVVATENERRIAVPEICKMSSSLLCTVAQKSVSLKSAQQGFDVYRGVMQRSPTYRALSGIGDEAFEYSVNDTGSRGATVVAMYHGSIVAVTLLGDSVLPQAALGQVPGIARGVIANIK